MKKTCITMCFALISTFNIANGLEKIIVETYYITDSADAAHSSGKLRPGFVTYRIYVDMLPGYKFQAAFGSSGHELKIETTTNFYNHEEKGGSMANKIKGYTLKENTVMIDSWVSAGAASDKHMGILKSDDNGFENIVNANNLLQNSNSLAGIPLKIEDGLIYEKVPPIVTSFGLENSLGIVDSQNHGNRLSSKNGSWACLFGSVGPDASNKVLIAQLTTDGVLSFELNIQIGTPEGKIEKYVARDPFGKEIQFDGLSFSTMGKRIK